MKEWNHYKVIDGRAYAVVYREKGSDKIKVCPFCNKSHSHSSGDGHRNTHCTTDSFYHVVVASDGTIMKKSDGYYIVEE